MNFWDWNKQSVWFSFSVICSAYIYITLCGTAFRWCGSLMLPFEFQCLYFVLLIFSLAIGFILLSFYTALTFPFALLCFPGISASNRKIPLAYFPAPFRSSSVVLSALTLFMCVVNWIMGNLCNRCVRRPFSPQSSYRHTHPSQWKPNFVPLCA